MLPILRRLVSLFRRRRLDDELREEIEHHIELRRQQLIDDGANPRDAYHQARRSFGNVQIVREKAFAMWSIPALDTVAHDVRYGLRMIAKGPGFAAIAVLSLAVGIGAATTLFSVANASMLRPLRSAGFGELVQVFTGGFEGSSFGANSYPDFEDFRDRSGVFRELVASMRTRATLSDAHLPNVMQGVLVSRGYFEALGLRPSLGRFFLPEETSTPDTHPVVVLSHDGWRRRFQSDPAVVGRNITLNGQIFSIVGIGPPRFSGTSLEHAAEFFAPVMMQRALSPDLDVLRNRRARVFSMVGELREGVTLAQGQAALRLLGAQLLEQDPAAWRDRTGKGRLITVMPELDGRFAGGAPGAVAAMLASVLAGVLALLGIACVNVATVLLARATSRRKEIAVRLALGASRRRLVQQLLTECGLLALAGGALGLLLARVLATMFEHFRPAEVPSFDLSLDYRILIFCIASSMLTVVLFGLAPALQSTRPDVNAELKDAVPMMTLRRWRVGLRDGLVVVQVALSLALLVGAALLLRSHSVGVTEDVGFERIGILNLHVDLSTSPRSPDERRSVYREAVRALGTLAGVEHVAAAAVVPLDGSNITTRLEIGEAGAPRRVNADVNIVGAGYFKLIGMPILRGREFDSSDGDGTPRMAVVNETMATRYFGGDAIGRVFRELEHGTVEVVGIVRDVPHRSFGEAPRPMIFLNADQVNRPRLVLHLRTRVAAQDIERAALAEFQRLDPAAILSPVRTMADQVRQATMVQRIGGLAAAATGLLEMTLAVMALYGVVAYAVSQRTREIGLRMALGAPAVSVIRLIMRDGLTLAGVGLAAGIGIALAAGPAIRSTLIGVGPTDFVSFGAATLLLLVVAAAATYIPARRALSVDPNIALRSH